jgi:hypothetical protein
MLDNENNRDDDYKDNINKKKREDKIFNNGYKTGEGLGEDDYEYKSVISINSSYSDSYLKDIYESEETMDYNLGVDQIFKMIEEDANLKTVLYKNEFNNKIKLSKDEINWCYSEITKKISIELEDGQFYNPIYIVEVLASILNINSGDPVKDYRRLFDALDVEHQQDLILELNKKYNFLDGKFNKKRMY